MAKTITDNMELVLLDPDGKDEALPDLQANFTAINNADKQRQEDIASSRSLAVAMSLVFGG